jgi:PhnB protein
MLADLPDGVPKQAAILYVYVEDADATYKRALAAGAEEFMPVEDQFFGDRAGGVKDAQGNTWWIATHRRDMTDAEIEAAARIEEKRRAAE